MQPLWPIAVLAACCALLPAGGIAHVRLGGIALGSSILDAVKILGMPDVVQTTDDGHLWQWARAGGLDREVLTDDDLDVKSVLVAAATPASTAQPSEAPLLRRPMSDAADDVTSMGGVQIYGPDPHRRAWRLYDGVLVADADKAGVARLRAYDEAAASMLGYLGRAPSPSRHRAPVLVKRFTPMTIPPVSGTAVVLVDVDAAADVTGVRVIVASGARSVDDFEVASMRRSTFQAATCDGVPCASVYLDIGGMSR